MTVEKVYRCNFCGYSFVLNKLHGLSSGKIKEILAVQAERHICEECLLGIGQVCDEFKASRINTGIQPVTTQLAFSATSGTP